MVQFGIVSEQRNAAGGRDKYSLEYSFLAAVGSTSTLVPPLEGAPGLRFFVVGDAC